MEIRQRQVEVVEEVAKHTKPHSQTNTYHTVSYDEAPFFMQLNPFVRCGYRPYFSYLLCVKSLFRLHNEVSSITHPRSSQC